MLRSDVSLRNHLFCRASYLDLAKPKSGAAKLLFFFGEGDVPNLANENNFSYDANFGRFG